MSDPFSKLGTGDIVPQPTGSDDAGDADLSPQDWFLLSRVDGTTPARLLAQMAGMGAAEAVERLQRLADAGLIRLPGSDRTGGHGEDGGDTGEEDGDEEFEERTSSIMAPRLIPKNWPVSFEEFTFDPVEMESGDALTDEEKQLVLYYHHHLRRVTYYDLFQLAQDASRARIKTHYFKLSKAFHPDRWYRKDIGSFRDKIEDIFKWLNQAYSVLNSTKRRRRYDQILERGLLGEWQLEELRRKTKETQRAAAAGTGKHRTGRLAVDVLLARAESAERAGDWSKAVDAYQRVIQVAPEPRFRLELAHALRKAKMDPRRALEQIRLARSQGERGIRTLLLEGALSEEMDDNRRAARAYRDALELEPNNEEAANGLERVEGREPA